MNSGERWPCASSANWPISASSSCSSIGAKSEEVRVCEECLPKILEAHRKFSIFSEAYTPACSSDKGVCGDQSLPNIIVRSQDAQNRFASNVTSVVFVPASADSAQTQLHH